MAARYFCDKCGAETPRKETDPYRTERCVIRLEMDGFLLDITAGIRSEEADNIKRADLCRECIVKIIRQGNSIA